MERGTETKIDDRKRTGGRVEMLMKDTGGTSDGGILFIVEECLLCNPMRSYKLKEWHQKKCGIYTHFLKDKLIQLT